MQLDEQLRDLADQVPPAPPGDARVAFERGRRRRRGRQAATAGAAAVVVGVVGVGVLSLFAYGPPSPEVADRPSDVPVEEGNATEGWVTISAGELVLSVPPDWDVRTMESTREAPLPTFVIRAGPCESDLYGGSGRSGETMSRPFAVIFPVETTGYCRTPGFSHPPEQPSLVLYRGVEGRDEAQAAGEGRLDQVGAVEMWRIDHDHYAEFIAVDVAGGLLVSHIDDPVVQQILDTVRSKPQIIGAPAASVSATEPFAWAVALSPGPADAWCATTLRGRTQTRNATGQPCDQLLTPSQQGDPEGFGSGGSEVTANSDGTPDESLSWGLAPGTADEVVVLFTDGTRRPAELADEVTGDGRLWAIGYEATEVLAVEARAGGDALAGRIPSSAVPAARAARPPQDVYGNQLTRQDASAFTDEQRAILDLRKDDDLYQLPVGDETSGFAVGIRARDGLAPLMFATACDLLDAVELPAGWVGLCLEYTDPAQGRVRGLFPHGTTTAD